MAFDLPARSAWLWRAPPPASRARSALLSVLWLAGAALLVWTGAIHLHLWAEGYRQIPTNGPLFLLDAVTGFGAALALLVWPRPLVGLVGAGYLASTLGALVISLSVGLFGFKESPSASFVVESLVLESVAATALLVWAWLSRSRPRAGLPS
jgi:hypothetical protein